MPLPKGTRFRVKTTKSGKKVRLAFDKNNNVIEAKNLKTGDTARVAPKKSSAKRKPKKGVSRKRHGGKHK